MGPDPARGGLPDQRPPGPTVAPDDSLWPVDQPVQRPTRARLGFVVAAIGLVVAAGWVVLSRGDQSSAPAADPSTHFYPIYGDLKDVGVGDPYVFASLWTGSSGRELPTIEAADVGAGVPTVASLRIIDVLDVDTTVGFTPVDINGTEGQIHTGDGTFTNLATGEVVQEPFVDSQLVWPIGDGLWAVLSTTLATDGEAADRTRRIAEGVTFTDLASWTEEYPSSAISTTAPVQLEVTITTASIPSAGGDGGGDGGVTVPTTAGP